MAGPVPQTIVLALGAAALGAPDAVRLLLGHGPAADITACVLLLSAFTALVLGTVLLSLFVRKALAMDLFAQVTRTVSVGAAFLVTACHLVASGGVKNLVIVIGAACSLPLAVPLLCFVRRGARNTAGAGGGAATLAAWADTRRAGKMTSVLRVVIFSLTFLMLLLAIIILYYAPSWREGEQTCSAA